ncbi:hypothetical protein [Clostridium thermarum]|uniref:hypothetical protein n=1 Tax=Clostridium thermarum TaxID=1716543 RepID=UPI0013D03CC9|nr:hypothetical protein [Clostridium thermarum]
MKGIKRNVFLVICIFFMLFSILTGCKSDKQSNENFLFVTTDVNYNVNYVINSDSETLTLFSHGKTGYVNAIINSDNDKIYFINKDDNLKSQIFLYNIKDKSITQITSDNNNNNNIDNADLMYMNKENTAIFTRTILHNTRNFTLCKLDLANYEVSPLLYGSNDLSLHTFIYRKELDDLIFVNYSEKELYSKLKDANLNNKPLVPPTYEVNLLSSDGSVRKKLGSMNCFIDSIYEGRNDNELFIQCRAGFSDESKIYSYSISPFKQNEEIQLPGIILKVKEIELSNDGQGLYLLAQLKGSKPMLENNNEFIPFSLIYFDFEKKSISLIRSFDDSTINTFVKMQ